MHWSLKIGMVLAVIAMLSLASGVSAVEKSEETRNLPRPEFTGPNISTGTAQIVATKAMTRAGANLIQYDTGVFSAVSIVAGSRSTGNRFNSNNGNPIPTTGVVTQVQFYAAGNGGANQWVSWYGPPNTAGVAPVLGGTQHTGVAVGMNTKAVAYTPGSDFLVGCLNINTVAFPGDNSVDHCGFDTNSTLAQGFHGMSIGTTFNPTGYTDLAGVNAIVRVIGTSLPVELQTFSAE